MTDIIEEQTHLLLYSFDCSPYTKSGMQRLHKDKRSKQVLFTVDTVLRRRPLVICGENVRELTSTTFITCGLQCVSVSPCTSFILPGRSMLLQWEVLCIAGVLAHWVAA